MRTLNENLGQVGLYWVSAHDDFAPLEANSIARDRARSLRNSLLVGLLGFAGVLGLILLVVVVVSLNFIAKSRRQVAVFRSELATRANLPRERVESLVQEFRYD